MGGVGVSKETQKKLLAAAANGEAIEVWMFNFIRCDSSFHAQLFQTAEAAQNWRFLESLSEFRTQRRNAAYAKLAEVSSTPSRPRQTRISLPESKKQQARPPRGRAGRPGASQSPPKDKKRQDRSLLPPIPSSNPHHEEAAFVPPNAREVTAADFILCPQCKKVRVLKKVLNDHMELSCPERGRARFPLPSLSPEQTKALGKCRACDCPRDAVAGGDWCHDHGGG